MYCENKEEKNRTRLTIGGNHMTYTGNCDTPTADLLTVKLLLNSIVSTAGAEFMMIDIKNFYLKIQIFPPLNSQPT